MKYQAAAPETLIAVELGDVTALYHRASGQTHVVIEPVPQILAALASPLNFDELQKELLGEDADALQARLAELEAIGLVERR